MDLNLTLNMIYELPTKVISISEDHSEDDDFVCMISESICNEYDIDDIKSKLSKMFSRFNGLKFYFNIPLSESIKITASYEIREGNSQRSTLSKEEQAVTRKIDSMIWASKFYDSIITLSKGLTKDEAIYLTHALMAGKSHESIAEKIGISVRSIQPIKKSCLVKSWMALETLYEEER